jgi:TRAP-type C4-dicarboxylate transport system permease small subunit
MVTRWFAKAGGLIIMIQMIWISYGVFTRYVLGDPDAMVTEATALLLFPVAFLGLAYALTENAYPTVTYAIDALKGNAKRALLSLNLLIMFLIGLFFSYAGVDATIKSFESGAASEILLWPRYLFWLPGAVALILFTWYVFLRLLAVLFDHGAHAAARDSKP